MYAYAQSFSKRMDKSKVRRKKKVFNTFHESLSNEAIESRKINCNFSFSTTINGLKLLRQSITIKSFYLFIEIYDIFLCCS